MPLSGAERSKLWRERKKENAQEYARYLHKERNRYHTRREKGDVKLVSDMNEREKRVVRKNWRLKKQRERHNAKMQHNAVQIDTPPPTPTGPFPIRLVNSSKQRVRRDRAKAYREIEKLKSKVSLQKTLIERYKTVKQRNTQM